MILIWRNWWLILAFITLVVVDPWVGGWAALPIVFLPWWLWLAHTKDTRTAFWGSFWLGATTTLGNLAWLFQALPYPWIELPQLVIVPIGLIVTFGFFALHGLGFGIIGWLFSGRIDSAWGWLFPLLWIAWDWVRSSLSFGIELQSFTWSLGRLPEIPSVLVRSPLALTLAILLVNMGMFHFFRWLEHRKGTTLGFGILLGISIGAAILGNVLPGEAQSPADKLATIAVWNRVEEDPADLTVEEQTDRLDRLETIIRNAAEGTLIAAPENTLAMSDQLTAPQIFQDQAILMRLTEVLKPGQVLAIGIIRETKGQYVNSALVMSREAVHGWSAKQHLIPFGETLPRFFQHLLPSGWLTPYTNFDPSLAFSRVVPSPSGSLGFMFCSEIFQRSIGRNFDSPPDLIMALANDSHVMSRQFARQQLAVARVRAVQFNRPVILATTSAQSAIIDASGTVRITSLFGEESAIMENKEKEKNR